MTVLAATKWNTNADLILACVELGYLRKEWSTVDVTWGRGNWWKKWRPDLLIAGDEKIPADPPPNFVRLDFTDLPWPDSMFRVVAFDPPYVCLGGRKTSKLGEFNDRYGLTEAPRTPVALQHLIDDGLGECYRVVEPGGFVLAKCADYITSGRLWLGTHHTLTRALALGFTVQDRLEMIATRRRAQPPTRNGKPFVQQHAGRNLSTLLVLKAPRKKEGR